MMKKIILLLNVMLFFSCGILKKAGYNTSNHKALDNTHWMMTDELGIIKIGEKKKARPLTLYFSSLDEKTYTAFLGCNTIQGKFSLKRRKGVTFYQDSITNKLCQNMSYETTFIEMIHQVNRYQIANDMIYLYRDKILLMSFKKAN